MIIDALRSIKRSVCGHVGANRCAGEGRASAPIRALLAAIVAFACAISVSSYAFAEESGGGGGGHSFEGPNVGIIFYGPTSALDSNANQVNEVGVTAYSEYDAAAYVLGYSYGEVRSWSSDIRAKLSNSETGGRFWQFAQTFTHTDNIDGVQWFVANILYGADLCWRSLYSDELFRNALADCQTIINGGDVGGGGTVDGDYYVFDFKPIGPVLSGVNSVYVSKSVVGFQGATVGFEDAIKSGCICVYPSTNGTTNVYMTVLYFSSEVNPTYALTDDGKNYDYMYFDITKGQYVDCSNSHTYAGRIDGDKFYIDYDGYRNNVTSFQSSSYRRALYYKYSYGAGILQTNTVAPVPPTNWPEPEAPQPPELPNPSDPVVEPPDPYEPSTGPTYIWNITNTSEPTDTSDLLEWIKKIFYELKAIHSDLKAWFENLGTAITDGFEAMDNACGQIYGAITEQTDDLISQFSGLKTYLKQLFEWLGDKMNFQAEGYDDTSVIYWLKRIWSKLGNGDINVRPTDPTTDPTGIWDWLIKLVQNFLIGLASSANDLISEIADLVSQVMHEFPFSIPWDIAAFLAAFAAAPITPDVDVTIPAIEGWWGETVISIDLSPYDTTAAAVRAMEKILFAAFLAWKSRDLLEFMDVTKWFNG